ncbi:MAG: ATP-binding cassette domain-containing protein [Pirellulales bacterium]
MIELNHAHQNLRAKTIQEVLQIVRDKLGPDACVLETREVRAGLTRRAMVEVDASNTRYTPANRIESLLEVPERHSTKSRSTELDDFEEPSIASLLLQQELKTRAPSGPPISSGGSNLGVGNASPSYFENSAQSPLNNNLEVNSSNSKSANQSEHSNAPQRVTAAAQQVLGELMSVGVDGQLAAELVNAALIRCADEYRNDDWLIRGQVSQIVAEKIRVVPTLEISASQQRIVAVLGPSGAGKTTLISKLARSTFAETNGQIGIISLDNWRHGAVEQLLQLAEDVSAEIEVVSHVDHLAKALQRLREFDLVLIDTAGRSPQDASQLAALRQMLEIAQPDESHLVMAANCTQVYATQAIESFQSIGATQICLTKLDEGGGAGHWLAPIFASQLPIQYLSHGASIDKDLLATNKRHLASILLGHVTLSSSPLAESTEWNSAQSSDQ